MAKKKPTASEIEKMYDSGENRVTQERNDFLLPQILDFVREKKWMNIRPEYQRRLVWDRRKKSLFIESLLMNIPVPPVFLYENDLNRYEVMDGQQRLNAILEFYDNTLVLTGLTSWAVLNGLTYAQCPPRIKSGLDRRRISANVLLNDSVSSGDAGRLRRTVFERLNTGGQQLNAQELRNSLYSGPFNELLIELAGDTLFDQIWEIPPYKDHYRPKEGYISQTLAENKFFRRMTDCEIVLRFFAFRESSAIKGAVRSILDRCMESNRNADADSLQGWRVAFHEALALSHDIFGQRTFQIRDDKGKWIRSIPLFDSVMIAVDNLMSKRATLIRNKKAIAEDLARTVEKKAAYEIIVGKPNTANAIRKRLSIVSKLLKRHS